MVAIRWCEGSAGVCQGARASVRHVWRDAIQRGSETVLTCLILYVFCLLIWTRFDSLGHSMLIFHSLSPCFLSLGKLHHFCSIFSCAFVGQTGGCLSCRAGLFPTELLRLQGGALPWMRSVGAGTLAFWPCFCEILRSPELVRLSTGDAEAIPIFDHSSLRREKWISPRRHHLWDYFFPQISWTSVVLAFSSELDQNGIKLRSNRFSHIFK